MCNCMRLVEMPFTATTPVSTLLTWTAGDSSSTSRDEIIHHCVCLQEVSVVFWSLMVKRQVIFMVDRLVGVPVVAVIS